MALSDRVPLTGGTTPAPVAVQGTSIPPLSARPLANRHLVSPRYFETLGIPIRSGREFDRRDSSTVPHTVVINEAFAQQYFPGVANPIGRTLITGMGQLPSEVVGVVADVRAQNLNTPPAPDYFLPALQRPETFTNVIVRTRGDRQLEYRDTDSRRASICRSRPAVAPAADADDPHRRDCRG